MDDSLQSTSPLGAADQMMGFTVMHLVLIVAFALLAIFALWWGTRLVRKRREATEQLEKDGRLERVERGTPIPPPADVTEKRSETPPPPTRPAPPPIAEGETLASPASAPAPEPAPSPEAAADTPAVQPAAEPEAPTETPASAAPAPAPVAAEQAPLPPAAPAEAPAAADTGDSLTTLKGVGPKVAARLNDLGIRSFADLAALSPEQAAAIDAEMGNFKGRMERDRWQEQAALLAAGDRAGYEAKFGKLG